MIRLMLTVVGVFAMARPVAACVGDCDGGGEVSIAELVTLVDVGLSGGGVDRCPAGDVDGDATIAINELVAAVAAALEGCPPAPTATTSASATVTATGTHTATRTESATVEATASPNDTAVPTPTASATVATTASPTATAAATDTATLPSATATRTAPPTQTQTKGAETATPTATTSATPSQSLTATPSATPTPSASVTATPPDTPTPSASATATATAPPTATASGTTTPIASMTPTASASPSASRTPSATASPSATAPPTGTRTRSATATRTGSATRTATASATASFTLTPTRTASETPTPTATRTATPTRTGTPTASPTRTATATPSASATASPTATATPGLGPRRFSLNPSSSRLTLLPDLVDADGFTGYLDFAVGVPDAQTGLARLAVVGASEFLSVAVGDLTLCIRPLVPVADAGVVACAGGVDLGVTSSQDHDIGIVGVEGFTAADCTAVGGTVEGAGDPHPGTCFSSVEVGASPEPDSGVGAVLIAPDSRFATQGLPAEISFEPGPCATHQAPAATIFGLTSGLSRAAITDANAVPDALFAHDARGENFSCQAWGAENGPGRLVLAVPAVHGAGPIDLITVFTFDD